MIARQLMTGLCPLQGRPWPPRVGGEVPSTLALLSGCRFHTRYLRAMAVCQAAEPTPTEPQPSRLVAY